MENNDRLNADEQAAGEPGVAAAAGTGRNDEADRVKQTPAYGELIRRKKKFLIPLVIFYIAFYILWPVLAELTTLLDGPAIGVITWALVYGFAQTVMVLVVAHLYLWQANKWDGLVEKARRESFEERTTA